MKLLILYSPALALIFWAGMIETFGNTAEVAITGTLLTATACIAHAIVQTKGRRR